MAMKLSEAEKLKRKLRKKLRQIENLEIVDRDLNDEELSKISKKEFIRKELAELNQAYDENEEVEKTFTIIEKEDLTSVEVKSQSCIQIRDSTNIVNLTTQIFDSNSAIEDLEKMKRKLSDSGDQIEVSGEKRSFSEIVESTSNTSSNTKIDGRTTPTVNNNTNTNKGNVSRTDSEPNAKINSTKCKRQEEKSDSLKHLRQVSWTVEDLLGHDDLVLDCDIDVDLNLAITSSRDTTVKVWNLSSGSLMHSLRGHTGQVTGVKFLSCEAIEKVKTALNYPNFSIGAVSVSEDCSIKIWDLSSGNLLKSIYTYNGITKLEVLPETTCTITGTDGGKLEIYDLTSGLSPFSERVHDEAVSALCTKKTDIITLASGGNDGIIKLFQLEENSCTLRCLFVSENLKSDPSTSIHVRPIYSISIGGSGLLYYGDNGCNLKSINWKEGLINKYANHVEDVGFTDSVSVHEEFLVASTYDIDNGEGGINVFIETEMTSLKYAATLMDGNTKRISGLRAKYKNGVLTIISCGHEVKLWRQNSSNVSKFKEGSTSIRGGVLSIDKGLICDSGSEEELDSDMEDSTQNRNESNDTENEGPFNRKQSSFCNCTTM